MALSFSETGSNLYSGGMEAVLVQWHLHQSNLKKFLPRVNESICHVTVSSGNQKIAMSTRDNGTSIT